MTNARIASLIAHAIVTTGLVACGSETGADAVVPPQAGAAADRPDGRFQFGDLVEDGITMTVSSQGSTVRPDSELLVEVEPRSDFHPVRMLIGCKYDSAFLDAAPYEARLRIPADAFGPLKIQTTAFDASNNMATSQVVTMNVEPVATMVGLSVELPGMLFVHSDERLYVHGQFADGVDRDVAGPDNGTSYASLDPVVATVDDEGSVYGLAPGTARIRVTHGEHTRVVEMPVEILPGLGPRPNESIGSATHERGDE